MEQLKGQLIPIEFEIEDFAIEGLKKLSEYLSKWAEFEEYLKEGTSAS